MPTKHLAVGLLGLLELSSAYLQLDFQKQRVALSQLHPAIRSRYLRRDLERRAGTVTATLDNAQDNLLYLVNVTVGSDNQAMALQLDTGSSDIWLPYAGSQICESSQDLCSNGAYDPTKSSNFKDIAQGEFDISYVDGTEIQGDYFSDTFGIGGASISSQIMGKTRKRSFDATVRLTLTLRAGTERHYSEHGGTFPRDYWCRLPQRRVLGRKRWTTIREHHQ